VITLAPRSAISPSGLRKKLPSSSRMATSLPTAMPTEPIFLSKGGNFGLLVAYRSLGHAVAFDHGRAKDRFNSAAHSAAQRKIE
jgi:hypothetical protein